MGRFVEPLGSGLVRFVSDLDLLRIPGAELGDPQLQLLRRARQVFDPG